jgi:hypothetical protein
VGHPAAILREAGRRGLEAMSEVASGAQGNVINLFSAIQYLNGLSYW